MHCNPADLIVRTVILDNDRLLQALLDLMPRRQRIHVWSEANILTADRHLTEKNRDLVQPVLAAFYASIFQDLGFRSLRQVNNI